MKKNVTYLLGAGASANGMPIVKEMNTAIYSVISALNNYKHEKDYDANEMLEIGDIKLTQVEAIDTLISNLKDLVDKVTRFGLSIDTYCKRQIIRNKPVSSEFKHTYSVALTIFEILGKEIYQNNQFIKRRENRYKDFFTNQLNDYSLKEEIKILNWNYDNLFESSYEEFFENNWGHKESSRRLNITTKHRSFENSPQIFKLNGMLGFLDSEHNEHYFTHKHSTELKDSIKEILKRYMYATEKKLYSLLSFAYEDEWGGENRSVIKSALKHTKDTNILVISGYSIPKYNLEIDLMLINNMTKLEYIYIQDINADEVVRKYKDLVYGSIAGIKPIKDCSALYMPIELIVSSMQ